MSGHCPVSLRLLGRPCVVVGGADAAAAVAAGLAGGGGEVLVIAPKIDGLMESLVRGGRVQWAAQEYAGPSDLARAMVVGIASGDPGLDQRVAADARRLRALVHLAADPLQGDFLFPEVVRRGALSLAVDTGGQSPALARRIRQDLDASYGPEYGVVLELVTQLGGAVTARVADPGNRQAFWDRLVSQEVIALIREGRLAEVEKEVSRLLSGPPV
ncbi:MAG TPA: bifunctional precorrin-2 dehydrogenase/sirohydrochlorin ferrochelatase [Bacillota bacterium]|nr:bifunctional precorrin-2 dehydrogenase/sirohydrochlorin ferrochelatase [Bacillota bacterium]